MRSSGICGHIALYELRSTSHMADLSGDDFYECDEADLTREDLLDEQSDFVDSLKNLGLNADFSRALLATASEEGTDALEAAAELTLALGGSPAENDEPIEQSRGDRTAQDLIRQRLAAESYAEKVASRPKSTSSGHASGKRHYEVGNRAPGACNCVWLLVL